MANNLLRKPQVSNEAKNKYAEFGFTQNPFPVEPTVKPDSDDERTNGSIFLEEIRIDEIAEFKKILIDGNNKLCVMMDYAAYRGRGIGKSAYLNYLKRHINEDFGYALTDGNAVLYAIYVAPTADDSNRSLSQITRYAYEFMQKDDIFFIIYCRLRAMTGYIDELLQTDENINLDNIANDIWLKEKGIDVDAMNKSVKSTMSAIGFEVETSLFTSFDYEEFKRLVCPNFSDFQWKKDGGNFFFNKLERLFKAAYFTNCIILLDEAEKLIQHQNFNERRTFCENVRNYFIDGNTSNALDGFYKMLITLHPNSQELLMPHWSAAGLDRICSLGGGSSNENTIFFKPLQDENLQVSLALAYLDHSRSDEMSKGKPDPFTREALCYAMTKEDGIVGKYLRLLYLCVEKAIVNGWNIISKEEIDIVRGGGTESSCTSEISEQNVTETLPSAKIQI